MQLYQFSVGGWGCVPSLFLIWGQTVRGNGGNGDLLQKGLCQDCCIHCRWPCGRPLSTYASVRDSWTLTGKSGSVSYGITVPFSWVLVHTRFCLCPPRVCFPSSVEVLQSNPTGLQSQIPRGFSVPFPDPQVGKSVMGPRTFVTVKEVLWCNYSPVCGSSAQWLYGGALTPCLPSLLHPEPLFLWQATADPYLHRPSDTQRQVWLSLCGVSGSWCKQDFLWALRVSLVGMELDSKCDRSPPTVLVGLLLWPWMWGIFFWWDPTSSYWWCSAVSCIFGVLTWEEEHTSL